MVTIGIAINSTRGAQHFLCLTKMPPKTKVDLKERIICVASQIMRKVGSYLQKIMRAHSGEVIAEKSAGENA